MKTKFTLLFLFTYCFYVVSAQQPVVPNGGFENWTTQAPAVPTGWDSGDHLVYELSPGIPQKGWCTKDTAQQNVIAGSASCKLRTDTVLVVNQIIPGIVAYAVLALDGNNNPFYIPLAFNGRPTVFSGNLKYEPNGNDTAQYRVYLTKWDATADSEISVVLFDKMLTGTDSGFISFSDTLQYLSSEMPDSIIIAFSSGLINGNPLTGSTLWVDNLAFEYLSSGVHHLDMDDAIKVYPNPAANNLAVSIDNYMIGSGFKVYDLTGRLIKSAILDDATYSINIADIAEGAYVYSVENKDGKVIHQNKFNVIK